MSSPYAPISLDGAVHWHTTTKSGADGSMQITKNWYKPDVTSGCPFCGCKNYK